MKYKKVEVEWIDAQSSLEQKEVEEVINMPLAITRSCGYLIHKDKEVLILAFMIFGEDLKHYQIIPIGMVNKIKEFKS